MGTLKDSLMPLDLGAHVLVGARLARALALSLDQPHHMQNG
jgi:hypothetical protein